MNFPNMVTCVAWCNNKPMEVMMISQTKKTVFNDLLTCASSLKMKRCLLKTGCIALFTSLTFIADGDAHQNAGFSEEFLYDVAHEGWRENLRETEPYSSRSQGEHQRNNRRAVSAQSRRDNLAYLLPRPSLGLMQTPQATVKEHYSIVPIVQYIPPILQLSDSNDFYRSAVGNQLQLGTCASFAVVDSLLYAHGKTLSPAYLNVKAKNLYAHDCSNDGLNIGVAMKCAQEWGTVMDWVWPYKGYYAEVEAANRNISNTPQPNWNVCIQSPYTDTQDEGLVKFAFDEIKSLFLNDKIKERALLIRDAIITHGSPVVISIPVSWNNEWLPNLPTTGKIKTLLNENKIDGWHAISICGFNNATQTFTFKNSWGLGWGNHGFGTITYDYIIHHAREAWIGYGKKLKS